MELRNPDLLAFYPNAAAVNFHKMFGDGEPQPSAPTSRNAQRQRDKSARDAGLVRPRGSRCRVETVSTWRRSAEALTMIWPRRECIAWRCRASSGRTSARRRRSAAMSGKRCGRFTEMRRSFSAAGAAWFRCSSRRIEKRLGRISTSSLSASIFRKLEQIVGEPRRPAASARE